MLNKKRKIIKIAVLICMGLGLLFFSILLWTRESGKEQLIASGEKYRNDNESSPKNQQIMYNGYIYERNQEIISILVMGIDKEQVTTVGGQSWSTEEIEHAGGHADALFLVVINQRDKKVNFISINRNSMVDVDVWDENGNYEGILTKQIALQHGYGDGKEESCERQVKAVSRMFNDIPINSYVAISMDAIPELNDAVGGVQVEVLDDIIYPEYGMDLHKGDLITLQGEKAYWYIRLRNESIFNSNELRIQRQKQYLKAYIEQAIKATKRDINTPVKLYDTLQQYIVTDIDYNSFTYLTTELLNYQFDLNNIYSVPGESIQGNTFEEFYIDSEELDRLILELFYEKVES